MDFPIAVRRESSFELSLLQAGYQVIAVEDQVWQIMGENDVEIFATREGNSLTLETFICSIEEIDDKDTYFKIIDLNTEIRPAAFSIDSHEDSGRLIILASVPIDDLSENELLSAVEAMDLAMVKAESFLAAKT